MGFGFESLGLRISEGAYLLEASSFFFTLVTDPRRSLSLKLSDTRSAPPRSCSIESRIDETSFAFGGFRDEGDGLMRIQLLGLRVDGFRD